MSEAKTITVSLKAIQHLVKLTNICEDANKRSIFPSDAVLKLKRLDRSFNMQLNEEFRKLELEFTIIKTNTDVTDKA